MVSDMTVSSSSRLIRFVLWVLITAYILFFGIFSYMKYNSFGYDDFDLAVHSQVMWNMLHGSINSSILGIDFLGNHAHIVLFLLIPLYFLFQSPLALLFLQTACLGLSAYPLFLIAKDELGEKIALAITFSYLMYPALGYVNLFEFHPTAIAALFLLLMFYFFKKENFKMFLLFMVLSLSCQENISLAVVPFGVYSAFSRRSFKWSIAPLALGLFWFWLTIYKIIPYFNKGTMNFFILYGHLGGSIFDIARIIITNPSTVAKTLMAGLNMRYIYDLLVPVCFLPVFNNYILVIIPFLLQHVLSQRLFEHTIYYHYTAEMIPIIFIAAVYGAKKFLSIPYVKKNIRDNVFVLAIASTAVVSNLYLGPHIELFFSRRQFEKDIWDRQKERFLKMIPKDASVVATFEFLPKLSLRQHLYSLHHIITGRHTFSDKTFNLPKGVEYALIDFNDGLTFFQIDEHFNKVNTFYVPGASDLNLKSFIEDGNWGVIDLMGSVVLMSKNRGSGYSLCETVKNPRGIQHRVSAVADEKLELIGYDTTPVKNTAEEAIDITLYWKRLAEIAEDYGYAVFVIDKKTDLGYRYLQPVCYRIYPPLRWKEDEVVRENYRLLIPREIKDDYYIEIGIFDYKDGILKSLNIRGDKAAKKRVKIIF